MGKNKKGFTIIEVAIFLAITGAILSMVMAGASTSVARRRYSDAVNDLVEQIRNAYSATINVQNSRIKDEGSSKICSITSAFKGSSLVVDGKEIDDNYPGRTRCAVYGQLLTFGEKSDNGKPDAMRLHRYDIIGIALEDNINPDDSDNADETLMALKQNAMADVVTINQVESNKKFFVQLAGNSESYTTQWETTVEQRGADRKPYVGAIMIVRSPVSGTVRTYSYVADEDENGNFNNIFDIQDFLKNNSEKVLDVTPFKTSQFISKAIDNDKGNSMTKDDTIICLGTDDMFAISNRRAILIHGYGSTESAVELLPQDISVEEGACEK